MLKLTLAALLLASPALQAAPATQDLDYKEGKTALKGFLASHEGEGKKPAVLIIHQWMGLTDYEKGRAKQIAGLGYTALAADIYGKEDTPAKMEDAGKASGKYKKDRALYRKRVKAGLEALKKQKGVDPSKIAVIGYCFGGAGALEAARMGEKVSGVISFHGALDAEKPAKKGDIKCPILVLHGADDPWVNADAVKALDKELREAGADYQITLYSGAVHAFTQPMAGNDPSKGAAYNEKADHRSWEAMESFFDEIFGRDKDDYKKD